MILSLTLMVHTLNPTHRFFLLQETIIIITTIINIEILYTKKDDLGGGEP